MPSSRFPATPMAALRQPCSLGLSALVAGAAMFLTGMDIDLDLLGYALVGLAILLLLHAGLSVNCRDGITAGAARSPAPDASVDATPQKSASRA